MDQSNNEMSCSQESERPIFIPTDPPSPVIAVPGAIFPSMPRLLWSVESQVELVAGFEQMTGHLGAEKGEP
jgi:hypothetical protein